MKSCWLFLLAILSLCTCKSDKMLDPQEYNGEYPHLKMTGMPINTYKPSFISAWQGPPTSSVVSSISATGQYSLMFKEHEWNHWPYTLVDLVKFTKTPSAYEAIADHVFGVNISAMSGYYCAKETVVFAFPAKTGRFQFSERMGYTSFYTYDCDEPKDYVVANNSTDNWVNITRLDTLTKQVEGSFDISFVIARKDTSYSIVYPSHIRMRGSFNGPFTTR